MITSADNFGIFISSKKFENKTDDFEKVPFYDTKYKATPIS